MATKKTKVAKAKKTRKGTQTQPKFPYTTKPGSLRKLLKLIPLKPKPTKVDMTQLRSWGFQDNNDSTVLRVLKTLNLITAGGEPTETYTAFMRLDSGARALGPEIKRVYESLFRSSHAPYQESNEALQNLFNIHSGGGTQTIDLQINTFKALCENATFDDSTLAAADGNAAGGSAAALIQGEPHGALSGPTVNINLHIHLPENKSRRDYEDIIEDIGRYIFGRIIDKRGD